MNHSLRLLGASTGVCLLLAATPAGAVTPPPGYIYSPQLLASLTQSCIAVGPGGTFVAIGPGFSANAQAVVLVQESGAARLVAFGFNSVSDCAYDAASDTLYLSDNAGSGDLAGALTGDTVFRIPGASAASGLSALGLELLPADSIPTAAGVAVDAAGDVYVGDAAGGGNGEVVKVTLPAATPSTFASGLDFAGGLAFQTGSGDLFVSETTAGFESQVRRFDPAGAPLGIFAGPSFGFGSYDIAFNTGGRLLATGAFGGDVVSFDALGTPSPFIGGLTFATGVSVNAFTGRVEVLSSTFIPTDEDRSMHRFAPVERLVPGKGSRRTECVHEFYGLELVPPAPNRPATQARCVDGDPCDSDGKVNDRCVFPAGFCLNVEDPRFPDCTPSTVSAFTASAKPDPLVIASALASASASLPLSGPACFFSDGITVPVRITGGGKKHGVGKLKVKAETPGGDVDSDVVTLVCLPAP